MVLKFNEHNMGKGTKDLLRVIQALAQDNAKTKAAGESALTDNSGGSAGTLTAASVALTDVAASGSSLAGKTTSEAALVTVVNALRELADKANAYAGLFGIDNLTWNGGGATTDGTIAAITVSVTGAATGIQAADTNTALGAINNAVYLLAQLVNRLADATGDTKLTVYSGTHAATVAALSTALGTAADPGVTKAAFDAELVKLQNNVATIADKLNDIRTAVALRVVVGK